MHTYPTINTTSAQSGSVQTDTRPVPIEALRACHSRNALLTYTVLTLLGGALSLRDTLTAITAHADLSRSAAYRALRELRVLGLVEHSRHGYKVCAVPSVMLRRRTSTNLKGAK